MLQGSDRLLMLSYGGREKQDIIWKHIHIPQTYLNDNWPIKFVSINDDATKVVVVGKRGFLIYNFKTQKWHLFGDTNHEQQLDVFAVCWFEEFVFVGNERADVHVDETESENNNNTNLNHQSNINNIHRANSKYEIIAFKSNSKLDLSQVIFREQLSRRRPLFFECNQQFLFLFTRDFFFYQYKIVKLESQQG